MRFFYKLIEDLDRKAYKLPRNILDNRVVTVLDIGWLDSRLGTVEITSDAWGICVVCWLTAGNKKIGRGGRTKIEALIGCLQSIECLSLWEKEKEDEKRRN